MHAVHFFLSFYMHDFSCLYRTRVLVGQNVIQWNPSNMDTLGPLQYVLIRGVSSFQGVNNTYLYEVGTWSECPD